MLKPANLTENQKTFLNAYDAIKGNDRPLIAQYKKQLKDYPLYPYLLYLDYKYHFDDTPPQLIENFIAKTPNSPLPDYWKQMDYVILAKTSVGFVSQTLQSKTRSSTLKVLFCTRQYRQKQDKVGWKNSLNLSGQITLLCQKPVSL